MAFMSLKEAVSSFYPSLLKQHNLKTLFWQQDFLRCCNFQWSTTLLSKLCGHTPSFSEFLDTQLSWLEQPPHKRPVIGSSPIVSIVLLVFSNTFPFIPSQRNAVKSHQRLVRVFRLPSHGAGEQCQSCFINATASPAYASKQGQSSKPVGGTTGRRMPEID